MKYYHPHEDDKKLSKMSSSALHRLVTDYRWVYSVFNQISGRAKNRVRAIQSLMAKRAGDGNIAGYMTEPEKGFGPRPRVGGGVTDHAIVRYLERVRGLDLKQVEEEMLERVRSGETYFGGAVVVDDEGVAYIMNELGLIKSVMPNDWLEESDHIAAEESYKLKKRKDKDESFRALAAQGIDTSAEGLAKAKSA